MDNEQLAKLQSGVLKRPACDANIGGHRWEVYDYDGLGDYFVGAADDFEDAMEYAGCCQHEMRIVDTE